MTRVSSLFAVVLVAAALLPGSAFAQSASLLSDAEFDALVELESQCLSQAADQRPERCVWLFRGVALQRHRNQDLQDDLWSNPGLGSVQLSRGSSYSSNCRCAYLGRNGQMFGQDLQTSGGEYDQYLVPGFEDITLPGFGGSVLERLGTSGYDMQND